MTVDGQSYEWMGIGSRSLPQLYNFSPATPISTSYDASHSNFTFAAGPVELTASFFSPVTPQDLCRTSIPLSYLSVSVVSQDGNAHNVSLYTDINGAWVTQPAAPLTWQMYENTNPVNGSNVTSGDPTSLYTWIIQLQSQYEFAENYGQAVAQAGQGVFPQWGNFTWSSSQGSAASIKFQSGFSTNQRFQYVMGHSLNNVVDKAYRSYTEQEPVFAFQHDLGEVGGAQSVPVVYTIGHVVTPAIRFLSSVGIESLYPLWNTTSCYGDLNSMIQFHFNDLAEAQNLAGQFETKLKQDINVYYGNPDNTTVTTGQSFMSANFSATNGYVNGTDQFGTQYIFDSDTTYGWLEYPGDGCVLDGIAVSDVSEEQSYYAITALAARQILGAYVLTGPSRSTPINTEPLAWQKEIRYVCLAAFIAVLIQLSAPTATRTQSMSSFQPCRSSCGRILTSFDTSLHRCISTKKETSIQIHTVCMILVRIFQMLRMYQSATFWSFANKEPVVMLKEMMSTCLSKSPGI